MPILSFSRHTPVRSYLLIRRSWAGIRASSNQPATSGLFLRAVHLGPKNRKVVRPRDSQRGEAPGPRPLTCSPGSLSIDLDDQDSRTVRRTTTQPVRIIKAAQSRKGTHVS
jgi:hypothetical protein